MDEPTDKPVLPADEETRKLLTKIDERLQGIRTSLGWIAVLLFFLLIATCNGKH